jgi:hypothetical protein
VKIINCQTGKCVKVFSGHRRTPWVVSLAVPVVETKIGDGTLVLFCIYRHLKQPMLIGCEGSRIKMSTEVLEHMLLSLLAILLAGTFVNVWRLSCRLQT